MAIDIFDVLYFNPEKFVQNSGAVFFTEYDTDAFAVEDEGGCAVYISTPDLSKLKRCGELFSQIDTAYFLIKDEATREKQSTAIGMLFPRIRQYVPKNEAFGEYESLRDVIREGGSAAFDRLIVATSEKPAVGLINISDVKPPKNRVSTLSGIGELDRAIGGFYGGELSIWTGTRGSGKSTLLSEILLDCIEQGKRVCAYSGELAAWRFKQWGMLQAAGTHNLVQEINPHSGLEYYTVKAETVKKIESWWDSKLYLYDNSISTANDEESVMSMLELACQRYGCTTFLCDNLMTFRFETSRDNDFYRAQSNLTGRLVEFAKKNNVHVHLVAHPRKIGQGRLSADDVGGSGDITNRADNVFSLVRLDNEQREKEGFDAALEVLKNRAYGATAKIRLMFDAPSRRFYHYGDSPNKRYLWELS